MRKKNLQNNKSLELTSLIRKIALLLIFKKSYRYVNFFFQSNDKTRIFLIVPRANEVNVYVKISGKCCI